MSLGNAAPASGAEWIGHVPHEDLSRGARPLLPADDPFYEPPSGFQHAEPVATTPDTEIDDELLVKRPLDDSTGEVVSTPAKRAMTAVAPPAEPNDQL